MMPPDAALDDATLDASEPVKELTKDDKLESPAEDEDESDESPRSEVRLERVSDNERLFCCEADKTVDVLSVVMVSLLAEGTDEVKAVVVTLGNDRLTSRGKYILGLATGSALTSVMAASAVTNNDFVCILRIVSLRHKGHYVEGGNKNKDCGEIRCQTLARELFA